MKLLTKLTLFSTISKLVIVLLFVWLLPILVDKVAFGYADYRLKQQEKKVFDVIRENGIDYYFAGDSTYGSYTLLKEEYVSLEKANALVYPDTLQTAERIVEGDTLNYRMLIRNFDYNDKHFTLEIGKTIASIRQYNVPLQRIALYVLAALVAITLLTDLLVTRTLLRPLSKIIREKLINSSFPFRQTFKPVKTSTADFRYLDESLMALMQQITQDFERERAFTSNASHELMTPISILQTKMENLMLSEIDEAAQQRLIDMMTILARLKRIVNALLLISRIENAQYARTDVVIIDQLIHEITDELSDRMESKGISLQIRLQNNLKLRQLNRDLIFQLFYNLITNAIRYNREGGRIEISDSYNTSESYAVTISDTGAGIPPEELTTIFNRFKKGSNPAAEGNGLGLSIVQSIAGYHGFTVSVKSWPGAGTAFTVSFPPSMVVP